jgi:hypothetical protein
MFGLIRLMQTLQLASAMDTGSDEILVRFVDTLQK